MSLTADLRNQHSDALAMFDRLFDLMDGYDGGRDAFEISLQMGKLVGLLRIHLAQEDVQLYPRLMASPDEQVARMARSYAAEMGDLAIELEIFAAHWSCSASIVSNFEEFRDDANSLLLQLAVRIEREDRHLYPLADAAAAEQARKAA